MLKKASFVAIIPARANSQRIRNKNLKIINGKPLIYWTIKAAKNSKYINEIYVTSDSEKILKFCKKNFVKTVLRPIKLSGNIIMPDAAISHAYKKINKKFDYILMLQPTSPLRSSKHIDEAIEIIINEKSDSLFSSVKESPFLWKKKNKSMKPINYNLKKRPRHQDVDFFRENGAIYITRPEILMKNNNRFGGKISTYCMANNLSIDVDEPEDLKKAENLFKQNEK